MTSSGIHLDSTEASRWCGIEQEDGSDCPFDGDVEIFHDSDTYEVWWTCPICKFDHAESWEDYMSYLEDWC